MGVCPSQNLTTPLSDSDSNINLTEENDPSTHRIVLNFEARGISDNYCSVIPSESPIIDLAIPSGSSSNIDLAIPSGSSSNIDLAIPSGSSRIIDLAIPSESSPNIDLVSPCSPVAIPAFIKGE
jgi:hypothetical protein